MVPFFGAGTAHTVAVITEQNMARAFDLFVAEWMVL